MLHDIFKGFLVLLSVIDVQGNTFSSESSSSSNPVEIVLVVRDYFPLFTDCCNGDVKVDDQLNFRHVDTSRKEVGGDDSGYLQVPEFLDLFVSFLGIHVSKDDVCLVTTFF